jgi:PadR family transcriptional regulator PadR
MNNNKSQLTSGLKKATIEMILLKLLSEEDMYGYQLTQEVRKRSNGRYTILEGSMYPILYRLADQKLITFSEVKTGKRQIRVYYHLEDSGREYFEKLKASYKEYIEIISFLLESMGEDVPLTDNH